MAASYTITRDTTEECEAMNNEDDQLQPPRPLPPALIVF